MPQGTIKALMKKGMLLKVIVGGIIVSSMVVIMFLGKDYAESILDKPFVLRENGDNENYFTRVFPPVCNIEELTLYRTGGYIENQWYRNGTFIGRHKVISMYWGYVGNQVVICLCPSLTYDPEEFDTTNRIANRIEKSKGGLADEMLDDYIQYLKTQGVELTRDDFTPTMLIITDEDDIQIKRYFLYLAGIIFTGIFLMWLKQLIVFINLKWYKGIREACKQYGDLEDLFQQIEKEVWIYSNKGCYFSKEWLIDIKKKRIIKLSDIVWFYLRHNEGVSREEIRASLYSRKGSKYVFKFSDQDDAAFFIEEMKKIITWCEARYSKEKLKVWNTNKQIIIDETLSHSHLEVAD
ncbi:hypothetical protein [Cellulosilyticum lentocellum]|uniref:Uncharacterized protein n=1 Tax=Cellulosilyticum lentocellum (strain ATCC 49066 / DSM 5427 / NCIMB 11756 / RHM5) TaxID=642492 RepID=F2JNL0_CELLD|nr:hypothetical protein [Cellulosilyticum lentocellum]ADZ84786.1 hypothetical protein Clole_3090 [Cellulosilyticum lentocellum DSM 5427]